MIRKVALSACLFLLTACATPSNPAAEPAAPLRIDPRVCTAIATEPRIPDGAGIPQAVGELEQTASEKFLGWVQAALDWGRVNAERAKLAKDQACPH